MDKKILDDKDIIKLVSNINKLKNKINSIEHGMREPIAIIGMSCRFPGGSNDLESYWQLLFEGRDAINKIPSNRFKVDNYYDLNLEATHKMYVKEGGFIDNIDLFDSAFFSISPREALALDPQQRMLLEVSWHALENAGIPKEDFFGSKTGVFVGMTSVDYQSLLLKSSMYDDLESYMITGVCPNAAAGRLSYTYDFHGPAMTIDTACSSSLVSIHLAVENLRNKSCDMALAGGVNLIINPEPYFSLCKMRALAIDGRCKTFDKDANGYIRGEGCGILVLKRLSDAKRDGDVILATIRGSAVNQDGRSNSFTAPNGVAQENLIIEALANANIKPNDVSYVETHGTGTPLGDPIEVNSLANVLKEGRTSEFPLIIGTVKTNIGHTESAAGIAGVIKTILALMHKQIPANLNFKELNPNINLQDIPAKIPLKNEDWNNCIDTRIAGVSSFGVSGTNAHVILEEYLIDNKNDDMDCKDLYERSHHILTLSAKSFESLQKLSRVYADFLIKNIDSERLLPNMAFSSNTTRSKFNHKLAVVGNDPRKVSQALNTWSDFGNAENVKYSEDVSYSNSNAAFLFTGGGSQYIGMGKELYDTNLIFKRNIDECAQILSSEWECSLQSVMWGENTELLDRMDYMQPALFAFEFAMSKLWAAWGVIPCSVIGHSLGEYVAATIAGVFSLHDGLLLLSKRAKLMHKAPGNGAMASIAASEEDVLKELPNYKNKVSIGAINGPLSTIISGDRTSVQEILNCFESRGVKVKLLPISNASHSPLMESILSEFEQEALQVIYCKPKVKIISNVTGKFIEEHEICSAKYWTQHIRKTVRFSEGMKSLYDSGCRYFIEVGPQSILLSMGQSCVPQNKQGMPDGYWLSSSEKDKQSWEILLNSLSSLYTTGLMVDWKSFDADYKKHRLMLPNYPFQRKRFWVEPDLEHKINNKNYNSLLGYKVSTPLMQATIYEAVYNVKSMPCISDHRVFGTIIIPGALHIARLLNWGTQVCNEESFEINELFFEKAIALQDDQSQIVQMIFVPKEENIYDLNIYSKLFYDISDPQLQDVWESNGRGVVKLKKGISGSGIYIESLDDIKKRCINLIPIDEYNSSIMKDRYQYGDAFIWVDAVWVNNDGTEAIGMMRMPTQQETKDYTLPPGLIDCCFQLLSACRIDRLKDISDYNVAYIPLSIEKFIFNGVPNGRVWCHARVDNTTNISSKLISGDIELYSEDGRLVAMIKQFTAVETTQDMLIKTTSNNDNILYQIEWKKSNFNKELSVCKPKVCLIFIPSDVDENILNLFGANGNQVIYVNRGDVFCKKNESSYTLNYLNNDDFDRLFADVNENIVVEKVIYLWGVESQFCSKLDLCSLINDQKLIYAPALLIAKNLFKFIKDKPIDLYVITKGVQPFMLDMKSNVGISQSPLWGLSKVISLEHPYVNCISIDLDPKDDIYSGLKTLINYIMGDLYDEDQILIRDGECYLSRLTHYIDNANDVVESLEISKDFSYLITGGLGGIGLEIAKWLVSRSAKHLVLIGRNPPSVFAQNEIDNLIKENIEVIVINADVSNSDDVGNIFNQIRDTIPPLKGIIHAAGTLDDCLINDQDFNKYIKVMSPKILGAWNLYENITKNKINLDFCIYFAAAASLLGNAGQSNYSAANTFLDRFAFYQNACGIRTLSIDWGPWSEVGMVTKIEKVSQDQIALSGLKFISPNSAISILDRILSNVPNTPQICVLDVNWQQFLEQKRGKIPTFLQYLSSSNHKVKTKGPGNNELIDKLINANTLDRKEILGAYLESEIKKILKFDDSSSIDRKVGLVSLGLDSIMSVEVRNKITEALGDSFQKALPATLMFNYPNIESLTEYLLSDVLLLESRKLEKINIILNNNKNNDDEVAIVGMACRFPGGADNLDKYWEILSQGIDTITEIPKDRFNFNDYYNEDSSVPGTMYTKYGAFIKTPTDFDADFFGISFKEAASIDPQLRVLLETSMEAFENSYIRIDTLQQKQVGVFIAVMGQDYSNCILNSSQRDVLEPYIITGNGNSTLAGRISYTFGFQGPCIAVDTACSSSLVAINLACESIKKGASKIALVAGVNIILNPDFFVFLCRRQALSIDGHCKTFDASADGFARGEGCGALVLKRLSDAIKDGDNILAVIKGSSVNQDGSSGSLTTPNGVAQEKLFIEAFADARVKPRQLGYIEVHGTGTALGDAIEFDCLSNIFSKDRDKQNPLIIGTVKTNIGHTESAAGIAGVIKTVLSIKHKQIPPHLNLKKLNANINLSSIPCVIPEHLVDWPDIDGKRIAGVSAFGLSGTNAHVIVEEYPFLDKVLSKQEDSIYLERPYSILTISAKSSEALRDLVKLYVDMLNTEQQENYFANISFSANTGRANFSYRIAVVAKNSKEASDRLSAWLENGESKGIISCDAATQSNLKIAFLFTGGGSQYIGMGKILYETNIIFKEYIDKCSEILRGQWDCELQSVMWGENTDLLDRMDFMQPALFAIEYSLVQVWKNWGVEPYAVMGHSLGEYVAATVAGVMSLEDGLNLMAIRSKLMHTAPGNGAMASLAASEGDVVKILGEYNNTVAIGAINGACSTIISGDREKILEILDLFKSRGVKVKMLPISNASHSPLMEPILDEFEKAALGIKYYEPNIKIISNISGREVSKENVYNARYWTDHIRQAVRFDDGMKTLYDIGCKHFVEIGPQSTLLVMGQSCIPQNSTGVSDCVWVNSLEKNENDWWVLLNGLGSLYTAGANIDWKAFDSGYVRHRVKLPNYPFQRKRYWVDGKANKNIRDANREHPLFNYIVRPVVHENEIIFICDISLDDKSYLLDHKVYDNVIVPAAAYVEMSLAVARKLLGNKSSKNVPIDIESFVIEQPLVLMSNDHAVKERELQVIVELVDDKYNFKIVSRSVSDAEVLSGPSVIHASGVIDLAFSSNKSFSDGAVLENIKSNCNNEILSSDLYEYFADIGIDYGASFRGISKLSYGNNEVMANVELPDVVYDKGYIIHPAFLDACFQVTAASWFTPGVVNSGDISYTYLPFEVKSIIVHNGITRNALVHVKAVESLDAKVKEANINIYDKSGELLVEVKGFAVVRVERDTLIKSIYTQNAANIEDLLYEVKWREKVLENSNKKSNHQLKGWIVIGDSVEMLQAFKSKVEDAGDKIISINSNDIYAKNIINQNIYVDLLKENLMKLEEAKVKLDRVVYLFDNSYKMEDIDKPNCAYEKALLLCQALLAGKVLNSNGNLCFVTIGADVVNAAQNKVNLPQSTLVGLCRVISLEHPELNCRRIDLDPDADINDNIMNELYKELSDSNVIDLLLEEQVAFRSNVRFVPRLVKSSQELNPYTDVEPGGAYIVIANFDLLVLDVAKTLVGFKASSIYIICQMSPTKEQQELMLSVATEFTKVNVMQVDVLNIKEIKNFFTSIFKNGEELKGIIQYNNNLDEAVLINQDFYKYEKIISSKGLSAWNVWSVLEEGGGRDHVGFYICFSSIASIVGGFGNANYSAACSFLDSLCCFNDGFSPSCVGINWDPNIIFPSNFSDGDRAKVISFCDNNTFVKLLTAVLNRDVAGSQIILLDYQMVKIFKDNNIRSSLLYELFNEKRFLLDNDTSEVNNELLDKIANSSQEDAIELVEEYIEQQLKKIISIDDNTIIDRKMGFTSMGVDSVTAVALWNSIINSISSGKIKRPPATLIFNYSNIEALSMYLLENVVQKKQIAPQFEESKDKDSDFKNRTEQLRDLSEEELNALARKLIESSDKKPE